MVKPIVLLLATAPAVLLAGAPALAGPRGNAVATGAYIQANYALVQAVRSREKTSEAAVTALLLQVRRECPLAAAGSPQNPSSEKLSNEVIVAMRVAAARSDLRALSVFVDAVTSLRWSNRALTSVIRAYVNKLKVLSTLPAPSLCADVKTWAVSGFQMLPASTIDLDRRFEALNLAIGELPTRLLAPYERPAEKTVLRRTKQLEAQLSEDEARGAQRWTEIMNTLALSP